MEKLLPMWIKHQKQRKVPLSLMHIQEKDKSIYEDLKTKASGKDSGESFVASLGWFNRFKNRGNLHNFGIIGEAASVNKKAAEKFDNCLKSIIETEGYTLQQIFNVEESGLFWGKMQLRTYVSREKSMLQRSQCPSMSVSAQPF
ncbi:tigger transposable element-derived protein 1-like [Palaemon carinicauda]|uniref:tigger transposable element-derived protein 1-like n=1 Tax=Palaemon carinicauda TaxID=392227 RepID=UPI0035B58045